MFCWIIWAQLFRPGEVCAKGFCEGRKGNFVLSAPGTKQTGLLVFSDAKHTRRSNVGACGPRFTDLNTRHDARQAQNRSPPGRFSWVFGVSVVFGDPTFSYFSPDLRQAGGTFQIAVSRTRPVKNILAGPDDSGGPPEPSETARMLFGVRPKNWAEILSQQPAAFVGGLWRILGKTGKPGFSGFGKF